MGTRTEQRVLWHNLCCCVTCSPPAPPHPVSDIYVSIMGNTHQVVAKGKYVAIVSTTVETATPQKEVEPGLALLEARVTQFDNVCDTFVPIADGVASRVFITSSYDASSHFESTTTDVLDIYKAIIGEALDLSKASAETSSAE